MTKPEEIVMNCPKCDGFFTLLWKFCPKHQKEYDEWDADAYIPDEQCKNGHSEWIAGEMQMTDPPTFPLKNVWSCSICSEIRLERSSNDRVRFVSRD